MIIWSYDHHLISFLTIVTFLCYVWRCQMFCWLFVIVVSSVFVDFVCHSFCYNVCAIFADVDQTIIQSCNVTCLQHNPICCNVGQESSYHALTRLYSIFLWRAHQNKTTWCLSEQHCVFVQSNMVVCSSRHCAFLVWWNVVSDFPSGWSVVPLLSAQVNHGREFYVYGCENAIGHMRPITCEFMPTEKFQGRGANSCFVSELLVPSRDLVVLQ